MSGWLAILMTVAFTGAISGSIWYIKNLQAKAAYCAGLLAAEYDRRGLENRVIGIIRDGAVSVIEDLESDRDEAAEIIENRPEPSEEEVAPPSGCAAERAPESILRYHGWLSDDS